MPLARFAPIVFLAAITGVVAGCRQPQVTSTITPGTDFSRYRTYAIKPGNVVYPGAATEQRDEVVRQVQDAVAMQLESRGLEPQPENPDLIVTYTVGANPRDDGGGSTARAPVGVDVREPGGNPYDEPGQVRATELPDASLEPDLRSNNVEADLLIDLLDGKTRKLVWRATSVIDLTPSRRLRSINQITTKAFAELPLGVRPATGPATHPATTAPSAD